MTDNPFDVPDNDQNQDNSAIKEIRAALDAEKKEKKELQKALEELKSFKEQQTVKMQTQAATEAFKSVGLPEKLGSLYLKANPEASPEDITTEQVKAFAAEYGLTPQPVENFEANKVVSEEGNVEQFQVQESPGFVPGAGTGGSPADPVTSAQLAEAARRGDTASLIEAAQRELQQPGYIKFKYPALVNAEE